MPVVSQPSPLDTDPATELRPGETGLRLRKDPYYGMVDVGAAPSPEAEKKAAEEEKARVERTKSFEKAERARIGKLPEEDRARADAALDKELAVRRADTRSEQAARLEALQANIEEGAHALDGEEQNRVEVLTGRRLQQRAATEDPRPPEIIEGPDDGDVEPSHPIAEGSSDMPGKDGPPQKRPARAPGTGPNTVTGS